MKNNDENSFTLDNLTDFCIKIATIPMDKKRKFIMTVNKDEYILFRKELMEIIGMSLKDVKEKVEYLKKTLDEGYYLIQ